MQGSCVEEALAWYRDWTEKGVRGFVWIKTKLHERY